MPPCVSPRHKWRRVDGIPMNAVELTRLSIDPAIAMENLVPRGYHVAQPVGDIFPLPAVTVPEAPSCDTKARY